MPVSLILTTASVPSRSPLSETWPLGSVLAGVVERIREHLREPHRIGVQLDGLRRRGFVGAGQDLRRFGVNSPRPGVASTNQGDLSSSCSKRQDRPAS